MNTIKLTKVCIAISIAISSSSFAANIDSQSNQYSSEFTQRAYNEYNLEEAVSAKHFKALPNGDIDLETEKDFPDISNTGFTQDGIYIIDKGHGWIRGEEDFIQKTYANDGNATAIETSKTFGSSYSKGGTASIGVTLGAMRVAIFQTFNRSWSESKTTSVSYLFNSRVGESLYARTYNTSQRFDTVEVKNGNVVGYYTAYIPTGSTAKQVHYDPTGYFNEYEFLEHSGPRRVTDSYIRSVPSSDAPKASAYSLKPSDIKFIHKIDGHGQIELSNIEDNTARSSNGSVDYEDFNDGYYVINYGEHWIKSDDEGVVFTMISPENSRATYSESVSDSYSISENTDLSFSLSNDFVSAALSVSYGQDWSKTHSESVNTISIAPEGSSAFTKVYSVNERIDVIEVRDGKLVSQTSTYIPNSFTSFRYNFDPKTGYDQKADYNYDSAFILGMVNPEGSGYIPLNPNFANHYINVVQLDGESYAGEAKISKGQTHDVVINFSVPYTSSYEVGYYNEGNIQSIPRQSEYGWFGAYDIWELNPDNHAIGFKISSKVMDRKLVSSRTFVGKKLREGFDYYSGHKDDISTRNLILEGGKRYSLILRDVHHYSNADTLLRTRLAVRSLTEAYLHTLRFDTNGGNDVRPVHVVEGRTLFKLPVPSREGYTFEAWYLDDELTNRFVPGISTVDLNQSNLYAKWINNNDENQSPEQEEETFNPSETVEYSSSWETTKSDLFVSDGSKLSSSQPKNTVKFDLKGSEFEVIGRRAPGGGNFTILSQGSIIANISTHNYGGSDKAVLYRGKLPDGQKHTLVIETTDYKYVEIDHIKIK